MLAEVCVYVPSIAQFRLTWLAERLSAAHTAALVFDAAPDLPDELSRQILDSIGARALAMKMGQQRRLLATTEPPNEVLQDVDIRDMRPLRAIMEAFRTLLVAKDTDLLRAVGPAPMGGQFVEIVIPEGPLRRAMWIHSRNIMLISIVISLITAALVYFALHYLFVRPLYRITASMMKFRADPEDRARILALTSRHDEIGFVEHELAEMQSDLADTLHEKTRLANLGLAVSKINHDLRNLLASAQLFSDRLARLPDPQVQRFAPKLMRALERAIAFCQSTLSYGRAQEPPPDRRPVALMELVEDVRDTLGLAPDSRIGWITSIERGLTIDADHDQLLRVLINLARNALQALETRAPNDSARDQIRITGRREGSVVVIEIADTGPGFSDQARAHLFEAFQGSTRSGGAGLGLVIADELVRAHGGEITLVDGTIGATFRLKIPDRPIPLHERRNERAHA
ncbi:MAG TPA: HAMP domain-containing sensor histidine kinase [Xanthobacteraceae bacterium]|nr:HAMP domain-containing sensor histidine kinase [Xanthobacteraceae bacterium]